DRHANRSPAESIAEKTEWNPPWAQHRKHPRKFIFQSGLCGMNHSRGAKPASHEDRHEGHAEQHGRCGELEFHDPDYTLQGYNSRTTDPDFYRDQAIARHKEVLAGLRRQFPDTAEEWDRLERESTEILEQQFRDGLWGHIEQQNFIQFIEGLLHRQGA